MIASSQQPSEGGATMPILQMSKASPWGELLKVVQQQGVKELNPGLSDLQMPS